VIQHERRSLRDEMANEILDKQKKLEEEKNTMSLRGGAYHCFLAPQHFPPTAEGR
jgi:hypothetical protein